MPIEYYDTTGQSLYVMFDDGSDTAANLTEGTSLKAGRYTVADSAIVTAGLAAGVYTYRVLVGTAASKSASDTVVAVGDFVFNGTNEVPLQNSSGYVPGVAGTLNTLDAVDTALDTRHTQTQDTLTSLTSSVGVITTRIGTPAGASIAADIASVGTITTYAKDEVSEKRTWKFTKNTNNPQSPNIVTVHPNFDGTLAFDLTNQLNPGAAISAVTSVTVTPTGPTISGPNGTANPSKTSDGKKVLFDIDGGQAEGTDYTFTCTVSTTDSDDALIVTGVMQSRAS